MTEQPDPDPAPRRRPALSIRERLLIAAGLVLLVVATAALLEHDSPSLPGGTAASPTSTASDAPSRFRALVRSRTTTLYDVPDATIDKLVDEVCSSLAVGVPIELILDNVNTTFHSEEGRKDALFVIGAGIEYQCPEHWDKIP